MFVIWLGMIIIAAVEILDCYKRKTENYCLAALWVIAALRLLYG